MKKYLLIAIANFLVMVSSAQNENFKSLKIGDKVPEIVIKRFVSDTTKQIKLSELYNRKLLVIEFWATWCAPCIRSLKNLDSLKNIFKNKLEILAVSYEDLQTVNNLLNRAPQLKALHVNYITDDIKLHEYFPHRIISHLAWIDSTGHVVAITSGDEANYSNVYNMLHKTGFLLPEKKDNISFNYLDTFHVDDKAIKYRSILTLTPTGITSGGVLAPINYNRDPMHDYNRFFMYGMPLIAIYNFAAYLTKLESYKNTNRFILDVKDSLKVLSPSMVQDPFSKSKYKNFDDWWNENAYTYELILPQKVNEATMSKYVLSELNKALPYVAAIEKVKSPCWAIVNISEESRQLRSKGGISKLIRPEIGYIQKMQNSTLEDLLFWFNRSSRTFLILDETTNKTPFDMELNIRFDWNTGIDIDKVRESFRKYGFDIIKVEREIDILVIRDK